MFKRTLATEDTVYINYFLIFNADQRTLNIDISLCYFVTRKMNN